MPHTCLFTFGSLLFFRRYESYTTIPDCLYQSTFFYCTFGHFISLYLCFSGCARIHLLLIAHFSARLLMFCAVCFFFIQWKSPINASESRKEESSKTKRMKISTKYFFFCFSTFVAEAANKQTTHKSRAFFTVVYALCLHTFNFSFF